MKYCGKERGSITLFLALILSLLLSLVCTSIESVRMASARTQILNSMDIGLYSVFGQYDRKLLEEYDLFAVKIHFAFCHATLLLFLNMICLRWMVPWEAGSLISQRSAIIWNPI